jgi:hypothetical protein
MVSQMTCGNNDLMNDKFFKENECIHIIHQKLGERKRMKRSIVVAFAITALCVLALQTTIVCAQAPQIVFYLKDAPATIDGKWTTATEWTDAATAPNLPSSFLFREGWTIPSDIIGYVLIEFYTDNTNDAGDFFQYILDPAASGGNAPQTDDILINYTGHNQLRLYKGTGTGWAPWTPPASAAVSAANLLTGSQMNATAHWIFELTMDRSDSNFDTSGAGYMPNLRVAVYDASKPSQGIQSWPIGSTQDNPSTWGSESGQYAAIPESPTLFVIAPLSFVAVAVGFYFLRKQPKTRITAM